MFLALCRVLRARCGRAALLAAALLSTFAAATPARASDALFALTDAGELITVRSDTPGVPTKRVRVKGFPDGAVPMALDARPSDGALVAGVREGSAFVLYRVDPADGTATRLAPGSAPIPDGTVDAAIDFQPSGDAVRVVTSGGQHLLVNAATGTATSLPSLRYPPGSGASKLKPVPVGLSRLRQGWTIVADAARVSLSRLGSDTANPNDGMLTALSPLNFQIDKKGAMAVSPADGRVYLALVDRDEEQSNLYASEPDPLQPFYTGPFPDKDSVTGLTVGEGGLFDLDNPLYRVRESEGTVHLVIRRSGTVSATAAVEFALQDGTAKGGRDFPETTGVATFAPGQVAVGLDLPVYSDGENEGEEDLGIRLTKIAGPAAYGFRRQARIAIIDTPTRGPSATVTRPGGVRPAGGAGKTAVTPPKAFSLVVTAPKVRRIGRTLRVPFRCTTACRVAIDAKLDRRSARRIKRPAALGRGTRTLKKAGKGTVTIRIPRYSKRLAKVRRGTIYLTVRGFGPTKTDRSKLKLKMAVRR